jgi:hypothetical protein
MTDRAARGRAPAFLVTIDTEGDDLWSRPRRIETRNARFLPRFQRLCESHGLRPTYLVDYEMARCPAFRELGLDLVSRNAGEIGMHLHGWNTPPLVPLTRDDLHFQPYLMEYPEAVVERKLRTMTDLLEERFGRRMVSHRAGRWGLTRAYARRLVAQGYLVDCSVTPHVSWRAHPGSPSGRGGPDFRRFPDAAYFPDLDDLRRAGASPLLEVPMTITARAGTVGRIGRALGGNRARLLRAAGRRLARPSWLRPSGSNLAAMLAILDHAHARRADYVEFMLHSSEFMPGGSPTFRTKESIETLYRHLDELFGAARERFVGLTLAEYRQRLAPAEGIAS